MFKPGITIGIMASFVLSCVEESNGPGFYRAQEMIQGKACEVLVPEWFHWAIHRDRFNPADCGEAPSGDVWFLTGNTAERSCTIPAGVALFFPDFLGYAYSCPEVGGEADCSFATQEGLQQFMEEFEALEVSLEADLDGMTPPDPVEDYLCRGPAFDMIWDPDEPSRLSFDASQLGPGVPEEFTDCTSHWETDNICEAPEGPRLARVTGYFLAVRPLDPGEYTLTFSGCLDLSAPTCQEVIYHLTVVPRSEL